MSFAVVSGSGTGISFQKARGDATKFSLNSSETNFSFSTFPKATFENGKLRKPNFHKSNLHGTHFISGEMGNPNFSEAVLSGIEIEKEFSLVNPDLDKTQIDRYSLEYISEEKISKRSRAKMIIEDDFCLLRQSYSGFYRLLNGFLILIFLFPYIKYGAFLFMKAKFSIFGVQETVTLIEALGRFVISGGRSSAFWDLNLLPFSLFIVSVSYNFLRLILLYKTMAMELEEEVRGLPVQFSFSHSNWRKLWFASKILFWVNLLAVAGHTIHFLLQRVPVEQL